MKTIKLDAQGSNWSEVTNEFNLGATFVAPNGFKFVLNKHKKAHFTWDGEKKEGAVAEVCYTLPNSKEEVKITTPKLKGLCGVEKSQKGETKSRKALRQKLEEVFYNSKEENKTTILLNFILSLDDCPEWLLEAKEEEEKRLKEAEEAQKAAEEEALFESLLKKRGYSLFDLKKKGGSK